MEMEAFAEKFKDIINEYKKEIISGRSDDSIESCEKIRSSNEDILKHLLIVKVTKGFWRDPPKINGVKFEDIKESDWRADYFKRGEGKEILLKSLNKYYRNYEEQYESLNESLFKNLENNNMEKWIEMALNDEEIRKNVLRGDKSWKIFLRDAYDFKYIPIDMHEKRFQIRTGIFHHYLGKKIHDPGKEEHYEYALKNFAEDFLSDINIAGYNLGENPGLVDKFIWLHCADKKMEDGKQIGGGGICAQEPNCNGCILKDVCQVAKN